MLRRLIRDKWTYIGLVLLGGGVVLLTGCASDVAFTAHSKADAPGFLGAVGEAAKAVGGITGMPWLDTVGGILLSLGGAGGIGKALVNSQDKKPFVGANGQTATEEQIVAAALAKSDKPSA